jgi:intraflagellar transport protein 52
LSFVYAYGATLTVQRPAVAILSSGGTSYPLNRPVCAFCTGQLGKGKLAVIGSAHMFSDSFLNKEENKTVKITIM